MKKIFTSILLILSFSFSAFAAGEIYAVIDVAASSATAEVAEKEILSEDAYIFGISEEEYENYVLRGVVISEKYGISGYFAAIAECKSTEAANLIYSLMRENHEWTPCDPAEKMIFFSSESFAVMIKGSEEEMARAKAKILSVFANKPCKIDEISQYM